MTRRVPRHVRVFLASPGDVVEERKAVRTMLQRLGRNPLIREDFTIEVVSSDDPDAPAPMLATLTPQQAVSRALPTPSECDITVVVMFRRIGTPLDERKPDGTPYRSGTEWEFEDARRAGRPILLYRRRMPSASLNEDPDEALGEVLDDVVLDVAGGERRDDEGQDEEQPDAEDGRDAEHQRDPALADLDALVLGLEARAPDEPLGAITRVS